MPNERSDPRPRVFSGIQPTGKLHIGNFIGALSLWVENQSRHNSIFCIVDLHALTVPESVPPDYLRRKVRECAAVYLACGIDPAQSAVFVQSHIAAHAELTWLLNCVTPVSWLNRMTQYKAKSDQLTTVSTGLLDYPVLQAADILLYDTDIVPVGEDQRQHVELTRDIAERFASLYGEAFVLPQPLIRESGARIMGLDNPTVKMSKSLGEISSGHSIGLLDDPSDIRRAISRAVTDSGNEVRFAHAHLGVLNLLTIVESLSGESRETIEARFDGKGYGALKRQTTDIVLDTLEPIRARYLELTADDAHLDAILQAGAERVAPIANATLERAKRAMGIG